MNIFAPDPIVGYENEIMERVKDTLLSRLNREPKAFVHTYGCQQNVADTQRLKGMLSRMGYAFAGDAQEADLILFNTCAVRENAEERVFGNVGALKKYKRQNPDLIICLCGCMMQQPHAAERIRKHFPFVEIVFGTHGSHLFPQMVLEHLEKKTRVFDNTPDEGIVEGFDVYRDDGENPARAWVPIMYGCNNFCTYCVVPLVRGRERSREPQRILEEVRSLVGKGYKEIFLLGQNVNSYGKGLSSPVNFSRLLREINGIEGDFWIRFMTSHPRDCTTELLDTMASCEKICRSLHLPVQSGSNRILSLMNQHYTAEQYLELIRYARQVMPDITLTSDIIVGFPGEIYEDFQETLRLVEQVRYHSLYTFIYSKRSGTRAAEMEDPVPKEEKSRWFQELLAAQAKISAQLNSTLAGKEARVLVEGGAEPRQDETGGTGESYLTGKTAGNTLVRFAGSPQLAGQFCRVRIDSGDSWPVAGTLLA